MTDKEYLSLEDLTKIRALKSLMRGSRPFISAESEGWDQFLTLLTEWEEQLDDGLQVDPAQTDLLN